MGTLLGVAACGSGGGTQTVIERPSPVQTVTAPPPKTVTEKSPSASSAPPPSASGSPSSGPHKVPDETGKRLDVAEDNLGTAGISFREVGGGAFGIVVKSNWTVCSVNPKSGSTARRVRLIVARQC